MERSLAAVTRPADAPRSRPAAIALSSVLLVTTVVAILGVFAIPASHSRDLSGLADGHGSVRIFDQDVEVDAD